MPRGGDRRSKYKGEKTKTFRIPVSMDGEALVALRDDLTSLVTAWDKEISEPDHNSSPRYDAAKRMLSELKDLLGGLSSSGSVDTPKE